MLKEFRTRKIGLDGYQSSALEPHIDSYLKWMTERGYSRITLHGYLGHLRAFTTFQKVKRIKIAETSDEHISAFQDWYPKSYRGPFQRRKLYSRRIRMQQSAAVKSLLAYLRSSGHIFKQKVEDADSLVVSNYIHFLQVHRGLAEGTISNHRKFTSKFYKWLEARSVIFATMTGKDVEDFILSFENSKTPTVRPQLVSFMKGFLRYLKANKLIGESCRPFLPNRRSYTHAALPAILSEPDIQATLRSVNRTTPNGKRDYAILQILKTYGIRGGELAGLKLSDIDWRSQIIHVKQTKTRRNLDLPLTPPVSRAIITYLRKGRPKLTKARTLFVNTNAPYYRMKTSGVAQVVARAFDRASIKSTHRGSHIFRHTRATELLRNGKSLKTIGDILGHQKPNSTFWYCKLAVSDLRQVALELPGGVQ